MLFQPLFTHAQQHPQDVAIIDDKGQYTYQQLAAAAAGLGMYLSLQTDKPSVGLLLPAVVVSVSDKTARVFVKSRGFAQVGWDGLSWAQKETAPAPKTAGADPTRAHRVPAG